MTTELKQYWRNYIDGEFVDGGAGRIPIDDPATGEMIAEEGLVAILMTQVLGSPWDHSQHVLIPMDEQLAIRRLLLFLVLVLIPLQLLLIALFQPLQLAQMTFPALW